MIRLILMRHGNTFETGQVPIQIGARTDLPLTSFGRKQAERMREYLIAEKITPKAIYAGKLKRQTESAITLAKEWDLSFLSEPALTEIDYGIWEGLVAEEIAHRWPKEHAEWAQGKWPKGIFGGTREGYQNAIESWLHRLRKTHQPTDTVIGVTSGGLLRLFRNEKVQTGHFCEIDLLEDGLKIQKWNIDPKYEYRNQMA